MGKLLNIPIDEILLDIHNPRIVKYVEFFPNVSEENIRLALKTDIRTETSGNSSSYTSLRESIKTQKGIIHPIIVTQNDQGRYLVIEGNTRVSIYKEFNEQGVDGDWSHIPAILYDSLEEKDIDAIRLQAHLVGPREWDPYSKAKYLNYLKNNQHLTITQIIDFCGGKKREVLEYIDAYNDMEQFYRPILSSDDEFDTSRFSAFKELQRPQIKQAILSAGYNISDFSRWVHEGLIYPLNTVRYLKLILGNEKSKQVFLRKGAREALKVLEQTPASDLTTYSFEELARAFYEKIIHIELNEIIEMRDNPESSLVRIILNLNDELKTISSEITEED